MESLGSHSVNNINNCNEDTPNIDVHYTDSALSCSNLKSIQKPKELDLCSFDHRNGSVDLRCNIQNTVDKVFNVEKSYIVNEQDIDVECDKANLSEESICSNNSLETNLSIKSQINSDESVADDPLSLGKDETNSRNEILEDKLTKDLLYTCNKETEDGESITSEFPNSNLCHNAPTDSNVNINDESLFEDVNNYNITDGDSNESSLQDPLFIGDYCMPVSNTVENKNDDQSQSCPESAEKLCAEAELVSKENSQVENSANVCTEDGSLLNERSYVENNENACTKDLSLTEECFNKNVCPDGEILSKESSNVESLSKEISQDVEVNNHPKNDSLINSASQEENLTEEEVNEELEAILAPQSHNIVVGYGEDAILITNLSVPPPVQLVREPSAETTTDTDKSLISNEETLVPVAKKIRLDSEFQDFPPLEGTEGKATLLKILPIKNGHGIWDIEELKLLLEDRGSILLRLCSAPEAGNEDIIDGPKADFTALLLDDAVPINEEPLNDGLDPEEDLTMNQSLLFDRLSDIDFSSMNEEYNPPFWKHQIVEPKAPKLPKMPKVPKTPKEPKEPKRKRLTPKSLSTTPPRGRKRGRPPLHNRAWVPKFSSTTLPDEPIKFRPPTTPAVLTGIDGGGSKSLGILEAALSKTVYPNTRKSTPEPLLKDENLLSKSLDDEMVVDEEDSVSALSDEIDTTGKPIIPEGGKLIPVVGSKTKKFVLKIPCPHCHLLFRKKAALTGHIKLRHKMMRKCPLCQESVKVKGKFGLKFHMMKVHKDEKNFSCDICQDSFQMLHYLKNHRRLMHSSVVTSDDDDEEEEDGSESDEGMSTAEGTERLSAEKEVNHKGNSEVKRKGTPEKETQNITNIVTRKTRSGTVYDSSRDKVYDSSRDKEKSEENHNIKKQASNKVEDEDEDKNSEKSEPIEPTRTLRSQSSSVNKVNRSKRTRVVGKVKQVLKGVKQDEDTVSSENGNESDDEEEADSDIEVVESKKHFCDVCNESFSHAFKLRDHKSKKHVSRSSLRNRSSSVVPGDELTCKTCQKKCRSENQLKLHIMQHKPSNEKGKGTNGGSTRGSVTSGGRRSIEVEDSEDMEEEEEEEVKKSSSSFKGSEIPSYIVKKGRIYFCTKCSLSFKRDKQMIYHLKKIHEALYPFRKCPHCPRVFRSSGPFIRHLREHRGRKCPVDGCRAKYKVLRLIKKHQRHAHPKLPHRCTRCVALFAKENELELHTNEVHQESNRRGSKDGDDEDIEDEDDVEEEEEDEDEDDEEEEEEEEKGKAEIHKKGSKEFKNTPQKKNEELEDSSHVRRTRVANISYKEEDDEDEILSVKVPLIPPIKKSASLPSRVVYSGSETKELESRKPAFISQSNPLKNLREAIMMQNASKAKKQQPQQQQQQQQQQEQQQQQQPQQQEQIPKIGEAESAQPPYIRPKRRYVRKAPYKKRKVDTSWTAGLKAQYEGFPPDSNDRRFVSMSTTPSLNSNPMYSPGITADVVRRVAESLLNKHQEQQQKQQLKLQKKQLKQLQQQNKRNPAFISYSAKSKHLPRIAYSNVIGSRDNSLSSFDDSSHADGGDYYGNGSSSTSRTSKVVPDNDGPDKVLRFDSF